MFVVQQTGTAYKLDGHALILALTTILDGHGGINSIQYTPPVSPSLTGTMTITMADQSTTSVSVQNGKGITGIAKASTSGLVDTYRISYNDGTSSTFTVTNGAKGDTGQAWYVWIRYAGQEPTSDADIGTNPDDWMGIYSGTSSTAPTHYTSYQWFQIKGEKGDTGDTGASIASVVRTSGDGSPGTYDIYTVTLDNGTVAGTFSVYNGLNGTGAVGSVNNVQPDSSGNVSLAASDIPTSSSSTVQAALTDLSSNKQNRITADGMLKGNGTSVIAATLGSDYTAVDDTLSSSSTKTYSINKIKSLGGAMYITNVAVSATTGDIATVSNSEITANHVVAECVFANPSAITTDVTWTTAAGSLRLNGTCSTATTANLVLVKTN